MARHKVDQARKKDRRAIEYVLKQANVYLKNIISGDTYRDQERLVYLEFLTECMDRVEVAFDNINPNTKETDIGKDLKQAFCLDASHAPLSKNSDQDFNYFVAVGREYEKLANKSVDEAMRKAASRKNVSEATLRKAWSSHGAKQGWELVRQTFAKENKKATKSKDNLIKNK